MVQRCWVLSYARWHILCLNHLWSGVKPCIRSNHQNGCVCYSHCRQSCHTSSPFRLTRNLFMHDRRSGAVFQIWNRNSGLQMTSLLSARQPSEPSNQATTRYLFHALGCQNVGQVRLLSQESPEPVGKSTRSKFLVLVTGFACSIHIPRSASETDQTCVEPKTWHLTSHSQGPPKPPRVPCLLPRVVLELRNYWKCSRYLGGAK